MEPLVGFLQQRAEVIDLLAPLLFARAAGFQFRLHRALALSVERFVGNGERESVRVLAREAGTEPVLQFPFEDGGGAAQLPSNNLRLFDQRLQDAIFRPLLVDEGYSTA